MKKVDKEREYYDSITDKQINERFQFLRAVVHDDSEEMDERAESQILSVVKTEDGLEAKYKDTENSPRA